MTSATFDEIHLAAMHNDALEVMNWLSVEANAKNLEARKLLCETAAIRGHYAVTLRVLGKGVDASKALVSAIVRTPISLPLVSLLLKFSNPLQEGSFALAMAAHQKNEEVIALLLPVSDPQAAFQTAFERNLFTAMDRLSPWGDEALWRLALTKVGVEPMPRLEACLKARNLDRALEKGHEHPPRQRL